MPLKDWTEFKNVTRDHILLLSVKTTRNLPLSALGRPSRKSRRRFSRNAVLSSVFGQRFIMSFKANT